MFLVVTVLPFISSTLPRPQGPAARVTATAWPVEQAKISCLLWKQELLGTRAQVKTEGVRAELLCSVTAEAHRRRDPPGELFSQPSPQHWYERQAGRGCQEVCSALAGARREHLTGALEGLCRPRTYQHSSVC